MTWRDYAWPEANPIYPIDYHPGARHGARGLARILRALYHANDYHGSYLGSIGYAYQIVPISTPGYADSTLGAPVSFLYSDIDSAVVAELLCRNPYGVKKIRLHFLCTVGPQASTDPLGAWTATARLDVDGVVSGSAESDEQDFEIHQTGFDGRLIPPGQFNRTQPGGYASSAGIADVSFGYFSGMLEVDVSAVDFSSSAGLRVQLSAIAVDEASTELYVTPYFGTVWCEIAERSA